MGNELVTVPKELRIERRFSNAARSAALNWLPVAFLAPLAFMVEALPAAVGILLITGFTIRELRRARGPLSEHLELGDSGDLDQAIESLAKAAKRERDWHRKSFIIGQLAKLELRAGDPETALALARESVRFSHTKHPPLERLLHANLAMILALQGESEAALEILPEDAGDLERLLVWARAGRWQEIADYDYKRRPQMHGMLHGNRVIALLKAVALSRHKGGALTIARYLDEARPRKADEFAYLSDNWPEVAEFIQAHPELRSQRNILQRA